MISNILRKAPIQEHDLCIHGVLMIRFTSFSSIAD